MERGMSGRAVALVAACMALVGALAVPAREARAGTRPPEPNTEPTREWLANPGLVPAAAWWPHAWRWNPFTGQTWEREANSDATYARWQGSGAVALGAWDRSWWDLRNDAASLIQQGPALDTGRLDTLALTTRMSGVSTTPSFLAAWSGVKFDIWFRDTTRADRLLYVEVYVARNGVNDLWCADFLVREQDCRHELVRVLHERHDWNTLGPVDDYMVHLPAFTGGTCDSGCLPALARRSVEIDGSTVHRVDVLGLLRRATAYLGRTPVGYELVIAGVTVESGAILLGVAGKAAGTVHEVRMDYSSA